MKIAFMLIKSVKIKNYLKIKEKFVKVHAREKMATNVY